MSLLYVKALEADASNLAAKTLEGVKDTNLAELLQTSLQIGLSEEEEEKEAKRP